MTLAWMLGFAVSFVALVLGTWLMPYRFPSSGFLVGASSDLGFNNAVAYAWYVAFLIVPSLILARLIAPSVRWRLDGEAGSPRDIGRMLRVFAAVALLHIAGFAALYFYKGRLFFSEANYFEIVLRRMVAGERPNVDVSFYYGPSMMYPAYWLASVVSPQAAYAIWYVATYVAGLGMLLVLLRRFLQSDAMAVHWFVLLSIGLVNPWTGLNVTFVRYLFPSLVLMLVSDAASSGERRRLIAAGAALSVALLYSFDVASVSIAAIVFFLIAVIAERWLRPVIERIGGLISSSARPPGSGLEPVPAADAITTRVVIIVSVAAALTWAGFALIDPTGAALKSYPEVALSYAAGAHNIPISPSVPFLALLGLSLVAAGLALVWLVRTPAGPQTAFVLAYLGLTIVTHRGAFGVSEPTRIAYYGVPTLLLCLFWSARMERAGAFQRWIAIVVLLALLAPVQYFHGTQMWPFVSRMTTVLSAAGPASGTAAVARRPVEDTLNDLVECAGAGRPYVMLNLEYYSLPVYAKHHLSFVGYYPQLIAARTREGVERMIQDVRARPSTIIAWPVDMGPFVPPPMNTGARRLLDLASGAPSAGSELGVVLARNQSRLFAPFTDFVRSEYQQICERDGLVAYGPRSE